MLIAQKSRLTTAAELMARIEEESRISEEIQKTVITRHSAENDNIPAKSIILHNEWLETLKEGDIVAMLLSQGNGNPSAAILSPVQKVARGLITVDGVKFRVLDGVRNSANNKWGPTSIAHPDSEYAKAALRRRKFNLAISRLQRFSEEISDEEVDILVKLANLRKSPYWEAIE